MHSGTNTRGDSSKMTCLFFKMDFFRNDDDGWGDAVAGGWCFVGCASASLRVMRRGGLAFG